jgi:polyhydroxybutyrate depolymerase
VTIFRGAGRRLLLGAVLVASACSSQPAAAPSVDGSTPTSPVAPTVTPTTTTSTTTTSTTTTSTTAAPSTTPPPIQATTTAPSPPCSFAAGRVVREHAGVQREVLVAGARPTSDRPVPVLVLFHGFAGVADGFAADTGLPAATADHDVRLVVPFGLGTPATWEQTGGPFDDAGFVAELVDDLAADPCVDPDRIWLAGYSAGAAFVGLQACALGDRLAGIVMNAAVPPVLCADLSGLDVIVSHGTDDLVVPYDGVTIDLGNGPVTLPSSPDLAAGWAAAMACASTGPGASTDAFTQNRWTGCGGEADTVDMLTYLGGGHRWPGRPDVGGEGLVVDTPDLTCIVLAAIDGVDDPAGACLAGNDYERSLDAG